MARKSATQELDNTATDSHDIDTDFQAPELEDIYQDRAETTEETTEETSSRRGRRSFNYDPHALGIDSIEDEPEDFVPTRTRTSEKLDQVRWLENPLAASYEKDVWKGITVANENVDALKQGLTYAVQNLFEKNMGISINMRNLGDGNTRVSFKMTDKRPYGGRKAKAAVSE